MSTMWMGRRMRVAQLASSGQASVVTGQQPRFAPLLKPVVRSEWPSVPKDPISALTESIHSKLHEKFANDRDELEERLGELNRDVFWSAFSSLDELARVESKSDILKIIATFQFISKKSVFLFSTFSRKIIANADQYSANELAQVISAFAQLGFLEESFCLQLVPRLLADLANTSAEEFVLIADGFATTRCFHSEMVDAMLAEAKMKLSEFTASNVALFLSSLARLNVRDDNLFELLSTRLLALTDLYRPVAIFSVPEHEPAEETLPCTARDVTLTAYAFAKLNVPASHRLTETIVSLSKLLIRDFTAKELQMLTTAFDRFALVDSELYGAISLQAQRRIAQFSCETLVHLLKAFLSRKALDDALLTRVSCHLPRLVNNAKAAELVGFYKVLGEVGSKSATAIEALRPALISKSGQLASSDWLTVLDSVTKIANPVVVEEILDAFVLVNASPANYRSTTKIVNSTVLSRMSSQQLVTLVATVARMPSRHLTLSELLATELARRSFGAEEASDLYCALVQMNAHETPVFDSVMRDLLAKAIAA